MSYAGNWQRVQAPQAVFGGYQESRASGDRIELAFSGTRLALSLASGSNGRLAVSCDGESPRALDAIALPADGGALVTLCSGLTDTEHEASIVTTPPGDGLEPRVRVAGFVVERSGTLYWLGRFVGGAALVLGVIAFIGLLSSIAVWHKGSR